MIESLLKEELAQLKSKNLYRRFRILEKLAGPDPRERSTHASFQGRELLLFCGNDYLGLSAHPRVIEALKKAADQYGTGAGAARLISGTTDAHARLEEKIAQVKKKERALVFGSGYLANVGILTALAGKGDLILMDKRCHASIVDGARLSGAQLRVYPHLDFFRAEKILRKAACFQKKFLVSETVFSMDGDLADLRRLTEIKKKHGALLVLDDAHGTGVLGTNGGGAAEDLGIESEIDVLMGTLSKAVGCLGGFAAASEPVIDYLINFSRPFIFATSLPAVLCAAAHEAFCVMQEEPRLRHRLWQNIQRFHEGMVRAGFVMGPILSPIFPLIIGGEKESLEISNRLLEQGILVPAIRTPAVAKGKARLRITLSAAHQPEDIARLIQALETYALKKESNLRP